VVNSFVFKTKEAPGQCGKLIAWNFETMKFEKRLKNKRHVEVGGGNPKGLLPKDADFNSSVCYSLTYCL
jgi:hypothetical protein